jgi:CRP/FNR family cyclic AMP-dependent transcriptional regulator
MKNIFSSNRHQVRKFGAGQSVCAQGDVSNHVMCIQEGAVKLTVINEGGNEAVVAILGPGELLGEACLAGLSIYRESATALAPTTLHVIEKSEMARLLHGNREFSDRFISYLLAQKAQVDEDLADQLLNTSEKRLAHILLRLTHCNAPDGSQKPLPNISQEVLAEMVGTTRSRVNFFMNKFRKLGFIEYGHDQHTPRVNRSLLSVVQQD